MSPRLRQIADGLDSAVQFTEGRKREDLDGDEMLVLALMHALQIVGEAAARISSETRDQCPEVPWASMIGMRHRLVHAYFDILWTTASETAPALLTHIRPLLASD